MRFLLNAGVLLSNSNKKSQSDYVYLLFSFLIFWGAQISQWSTQNCFAVVPEWQAIGAEPSLSLVVSSSFLKTLLPTDR